MGDEVPQGQPTVPTDLGAMVASDLERARDAEKRTSDRLKLIRAKCRFLEGVQEFDQDTSPGRLWLFLSDQERTLRRIEQGGGDVPAWLDGLKKNLRDRLQELARTWPSAFVDALDDRGIEPDRTSRHPTYSFMDGFLSVHLDDRKLAVQLNTRNVAPVVLPLDPLVVADEVQTTQQRLLERGFDADDYLQGLLDAYDAVSSEAGATPGDDQRLPKVLERYAKDRDQPRDELLIDLGRLLKQGNPEHEGRRLRLGHTRRDRDGVLVPGFENGGYMGFIAFRHEESSR